MGLSIITDFFFFNEYIVRFVCDDDMEEQRKNSY